VRHQADLPAAEEIGAEAGRRAVSRLGARKLESRTAAVIFENRQAASLLSPFVGAIAGPSVARGNSFLKDRLGQPVFAPGIQLIDDPHRPRGLGSSPYDDEGVANARRALVADGVLTTWLLNSSSARQLGLETTGHASRGLAGAPGVAPNNLHMEPGTEDLAGLMRQAGSGVLVTSMFGPSLNANTGDWSAGVSGFWFEGGEIAYPVDEITVAGNLLDIYARLVPGSDLEFRGATNAPSILVDAMAVAGR
jgi:PmbA protein